VLRPEAREGGDESGNRRRSNVEKRQFVHVLIGVESEFTAEGIRSYLLSEGFSVAGVELNPERILERVSTLHPEIVIFKLRRVELRRPDFVSTLAHIPKTRTILWLSKLDIGCVPRLIKDGVRACVLRAGPREELVAAIEAVMRGELFFSRGIRDAMGESAIEGLQQGRGIQSLSEQELRVLTLISDGLSNKEIACAMRIDSRTVESHRHSLKQKLGIHSVAGLTKFAVRHCLTTLD
jgi:two-component system nitrate/nitrite response regulator NarL